MAISKQESVRKRITRGHILHILYISQETPMMLHTIELCMQPENPGIGAEMVSHINYLIDRGYILVKKPKGALVRITSKGQDVIEGTIADSGIIVPNERP